MTINFTAKNIAFTLSFFIITLQGCNSSSSTPKAVGEEANSTDISADTTAPVIKLNGGDVTLIEGVSYVEKGAVATDDRDGKIKVVITGNVDIKNEGNYKRVYSATDKAGNKAKTTRKITVLETQAIPYDIHQFDGLEKIHQTQAESFDFKIDASHPQHNNWSLYKTSIVESSEGKGKILIPAGHDYQKYANSDSAISVEGGKTYTIMMDVENESSTTPARFRLRLHFLSDSGYDSISKTFAYRDISTKPTTKLFAFSIPEGYNTLKLGFEAGYITRAAPSIYTKSSTKISNIKMYKGLKLLVRPTKKKLITTAVTLTDTSVWKDLRTNKEFFPIFAYTGAGMYDGEAGSEGALHYPELSATGFNGITGGAFTRYTDKPNSMSQMAPSGITRNLLSIGTRLGDRLYSDENGVAQTSYMPGEIDYWEKEKYYNDLLIEFIKKDYEQDFVGFTIDNENNQVFDKKNDFFTFLESIEWLNKFPFYVLDGDAAVSDVNPWVDVVGTYVSNDIKKSDVYNPLSLLTQDHSVKAHASIAQIQIMNGEVFVPLTFASIIYGATGVGFWADGRNWHGKHYKISDLSWYKNGKGAQLSKDIQKMLDNGILQAPYLNGFWVTVSKGDQGKLFAGTRIVGDQAYIIVSNLFMESKTVEISFDRLHHNLNKISYLIQNGATKATILESKKVGSKNFKGKLSVTLPERGYTVLKLN